MRLSQAASAYLLESFDAYCRERSIRFQLIGGALIGAVRHGGWLPWDDDVDVQMFREDYERLHDAWLVSGIAGLDLSDPIDNPLACSVVPRLRLTQSGLRYTERFGIEMPERRKVCLDITILDEAPRSAVVVRLWLLSTRLIQGMIAFRATTPVRIWRAESAWPTRILASAAWAASRAVPRTTQQRAYRAFAAAFRGSGSRTWYGHNAGSHFRDVGIPEPVLESQPVDFEGATYPAPEPNAFLISQYGPGYLTPPPPEARCAHGYTQLWADLPPSSQIQPDSANTADVPR